jgi:glutamate dehydrogenase/leucine dehydrogenase
VNGAFLAGVEHDELGPVQVVHLYDPACELRAIVVIDNVAAGPAIGGVRMAADVGLAEVARLARAMTLKNAAAGLAHGGAKAGIAADPHRADRESLVRAFARAMRELTSYVPGPDMGTDEGCMAWIRDEIGRAVGLPRVLGGIPLDELGATGFGLAHCAEVAAAELGLSLRGATLAVEGFGSVGRHAARFMAERGTHLVAASDSRGAIHARQGLDPEALAAFKRETGSVVRFPGARALSPAELLAFDCDILVPAARPDTIRADNAASIRARLVLEGANIPVTPEAEQALHARGVLCVPDFIANAGGVICAALELAGSGERAAFDAIAERIRRNTAEVLARSRGQGILPRQAALALARSRVEAAQSFRRRG